jgi:predicted Zn-dependent peptidase
MKKSTIQKLMKTSTFAVALTLLSVNALAQQPGRPPQPQSGPAGQSSKGAVIKGKTPINRDVLKLKLPKAQETTLPNGLQIVLLENRKIPTFSMQLQVLSGGLSDPASQRGLAAVTASLLREGTAKRSNREIAEQTEMLGSTLNSISGVSGFTSSVNTSGLIENFDSSLDIFADVVRNPQFPGTEVEKYKNRTLAQLQIQRSIPQLLAAERFHKAVYGAHPASEILLSESIKSITADDLKRFHQTYYRPNNAILAVVGDITMKELLPKLEKAFADWQKSEVPATKIPAANAPEKNGVFLINRPGSVQTVLTVGGLGIERTSPDYFAVQVMNQILGGGASSRLFLNLREDKGYTYGAYSNLLSSKYAGLVWAESEVRTEVTEGALKEIMFELKRLREEPVSATEFENAKRALTGSFALSLEQPQSLVSNLTTLKLYNLPADYWDVYPQRINAVTLEDVRRVANKYYDPARLQIIAVGDAAKVRDALSKYGAVETFEVETKPGAPMITNRPN